MAHLPRSPDEQPHAAREVALVPVPPSGPLREAVLRLAPRPDQEEFSGRADQTLPLAERDPARTPYALLEDGAPVAFLVLDRTPPAADPSADLLLRGFFVDAAAQGRGVATRTVALLPEVVRRDFPDVRCVVLTVNVRNPAARAVYVRGGFVDGGELDLGGSVGPQHVLRLELEPGQRGGQVHRSPVVLAALLALVACGSSEQRAATTPSPTPSPAAADPGCPPEHTAGAGEPAVPALPTTETAGRLVPDADPVEALVCRYEARADGPAPLVGARSLAGGLDRIRTELHLPAQAPGSATCAPGSGRPVPHLVRLRYADGELWLSAVQGSCAGTGNGAFVTSTSLGERFAQAYDAGTWPAAR